MKKNTTAKIKAVLVKTNSKLTDMKHRNAMYESSDKSIVKVTRKGKVKAIGEGKCKIFCYAQNGVSKEIQVEVK